MSEKMKKRMKMKVVQKDCSEKKKNKIDNDLLFHANEKGTELLYVVYSGHLRFTPLKKIKKMSREMVFFSVLKTHLCRGNLLHLGMMTFSYLNASLIHLRMLRYSRGFPDKCNIFAMNFVCRKQSKDSAQERTWRKRRGKEEEEE